MVVVEEFKVGAASKEVVMESNEQTQIMKGKRTKRQRPLSPIPFPLPVSSLNGCKEGEFESTSYIDMKSSLVSSNEYMNSCTKEEEDLANCLILLAQGQYIRRESSRESADNNNNVETRKFSSRRFLETASNGDGKAGYYVYECKTCNRMFPSFQALGGHRASHKKPRPAYAEETKKSNKSLVEPYEQDGRYRNINSPFSLQLSYDHRRTYSNNINNNNNNKGNKVHECGICGAEFNSGQALGGHMRRHRGQVGANTALSLTLLATESDRQDQAKTTRNMLSLDLDLNFPAPAADNLELGSHFASKQEQEQEIKKQEHQQHQQDQQQQQQSSLAFSAPTLVDCHY